MIRQLFSRLFSEKRPPIIPPRPPVRATYDAAAEPTDLQNYWANADLYDADSANSQPVRQKLVSRSRYEIANNGYADGIARTYADDVVGTGPNLRINTGSAEFNRVVESTWREWSRSIQLSRKLWCLAHAKHVDGEAFGVLVNNPNVAHEITLDVQLHETDQIRTPQLPWRPEQPDVYIDGIKLDRYGNPEWYDLLPYHPGSNSQLFNQTPIRVDPSQVLHWYKLRRPNQHRAVPEQTSTLNTGAAARRWRSAVLAAAESAADFSVLLKTAFPPDELDGVSPMTTLDIQKRMLMALPMGWDAQQMRAEQPTATHAEFSRSLVSEMARPSSMPFNKAACDSSDYNFASGRLDHITYYRSLDVDRSDAELLVLVPLFVEWFRESQLRFGWLQGDQTAVVRILRLATFDWPRHAIADEKSEAEANDKKLRNGSLSLSRLYASQGIDFEDEVATMAADYGISEMDMRKTLLLTFFPMANNVLSPPEPPQVSQDGDEQDDNQNNDDNDSEAA